MEFGYIRVTRSNDLCLITVPILLAEFFPRLSQLRMQSASAPTVHKLFKDSIVFFMDYLVQLGPLSIEYWIKILSQFTGPSFVYWKTIVFYCCFVFIIIYLGIYCLLYWINVLCSVHEGRAQFTVIQHSNVSIEIVHTGFWLNIVFMNWIC